MWTVLSRTGALAVSDETEEGVQARQMVGLIPVGTVVGGGAAADGGGCRRGWKN